MQALAYGASRDNALINSIRRQSRNLSKMLPAREYVHRVGLVCATRIRATCHDDNVVDLVTVYIGAHCYTTAIAVAHWADQMSVEHSILGR